MAGALGGRGALPFGHRSGPAQALRADHAPLSVGGPAHRPLVRHLAVGRPRPLHADAGVQCGVPDGFRRLRAAGRERGHQAQHPSQEVDLRQHRAHARPAPPYGHDDRLAARGHLLRPRVLPLDAVVLPPALPVRPGLSQEGGGRLVSELQHDPRPRAGDRRRPPVRALRHAGHPQGAGAVVLPHHALRRGAARLLGHRLARARQDAPGALDRPLRGRLRHLPHRSRASRSRSSPPGRTPSGA